MRMPQVEEALVSYLSPGAVSSQKAPTLPTKPCHLTSKLVGKVYVVAGQAGGELYTMGVLQANQADLLRDLNCSEGLSPEAVIKLRHTTDFALCATKQAAHAISSSLAAMIATEQHLWLDLSGLKEKGRAFLMFAPISPSRLSGAVIEEVHYIPTVVRTLQSPLLTKPKEDFRDVIMARQQSKSNP